MPHKDKSIGRAYQSWRMMMRRCYDTTFDGYKHYGAKGVSVCERWHQFSAFVSDMGSRPEGHILDRIENGVGYMPSNCRWATFKQSTENRTNSIWITVNGERLRVPEVSKRYGIPEHLLYRRAGRNWPESGVLFQGRWPTNIELRAMGIE